MKKIFYKIIFFLPVFFFFTLKSNASHIVGGEIYYRYLGSNDYEITLNIYFDCEHGMPGALSQDTVFYLTVFDGNNNQIIPNLSIHFGNADTLGNSLTFHCVIPPTDVCVMKRNYVDTVNLPPNASGYQIVAQRCCRNEIIKNIVNPDNTGATYYALIPSIIQAPINNNPVFNTFPPLYICNKLQLIYDHSATDANGDSLVYELCEPFIGGSPGNSKPTIASVPPYTPVSWVSPYSINNLLGGVPLQIDSKTGLISATPDSLGNFVVGICVSEYRNGVFLSRTNRDFQFNVVSCDPTVVSAFFAPVINCSDTVNFANNSSGATQYLWNFGDLSVNNDTSNLFEPTYIYPDTGNYSITLFASDTSANCYDTATYSLYVGKKVAADAGTDQVICLGDTVTLNGNGNGIFQWNPAATLLFPDSSKPKVFPGTSTDYILNIINGLCSATDTVTVNVTNLYLGGSDKTICIGDSITIGSPFEDGVVYQWIPSTGLSSDTIANPFAKPNKTTFYILNASNTLCQVMDSISVSVTDLPRLAGSDKGLCKDSAIQIGFPPQMGLKYHWTPSTGLSSDTVANPFANPVTNFVYLLTVSDTLCSITDTVNISVSEITDVPVFNNMQICTYDTIQINNVPNILYTYTWTPSYGLSDSAIWNPLASPDSTITYFLTISDGICNRKDLLQITVRNLNYKAGNDTFICIGGTVPIGINPETDLKYQWYPDYHLTLDTISNPVANPDTTTVYILTVSDNFCIAHDTVSVSVLKNKNKILPAKSICLNDTLPIGLFPNSSLTYHWNHSNTLSDSSIADPFAFPDGNTNYILLLSGGGCTDTFHQQVIVGPPLSFRLMNDTLYCGKQDLQIGIPDSGYSYIWSPSKGLSDSTIANPFADIDTTTTYTLTINNGFCAKKDSLTIFFSDTRAVADFSVSAFFNCEKIVLTMNNKSKGGNQYQWFFADGSFTSTSQPVLTIPYGSSNSVKLVVINKEGCSDTMDFGKDQLKKLIKENFPNVFTPNHDGYNDCFKIIYDPDYQLSENCYELTIYNRWGEKLFQSNDAQKCWDGTLQKNGKPVSEGVYFYNLKIRDLTFPGYVHLIR